MNGAIRPFGDYVLLGELGRGASSVVYQARHITLNRSVALKVIRTAGILSSEDLRRFRTEAEAGAALDHPNIVPVFEVGEHKDQPFLAMKLMPGGTLAERLAEGPFEPAEMAACLATVARAVHYAHQRGVLHRDLKPGNILLDEAGTPHLSDFGLAKVTQARPDLTHSHAFLGTPAYMAPEVAAQGVRAAAVAADIYGIGAILYEMLAGRPPFVGETVPVLLRQIVEEELQPPSRFTPVPRDLEAICLHCLSRDPAKRYETAEALADDLDCFRRGDLVSARAPTWIEFTRAWFRRHRVAAVWGTTLLASLVVGLVLTSIQWRRAEGHFRESETSKRRLAMMATASADRLFAARQPHDAVVALAELLQGSPENRVAAMRLFCALTQLTWPWPVHPPFEHAGEVVQGAFTADGRWILTATREPPELRVWDAAQGSLLTILPHDASSAVFALSGDGRFLATISTNGQPLVWTLLADSWVPVGRVSAEPLQSKPMPGSTESRPTGFMVAGPAPEAERASPESVSPVTAVALDPHGVWLATGDRQGNVRLDPPSPPTTNAQPHALSPNLGATIRRLEFHPAEPFLLAVGYNTAQVWRLGGRGDAGHIRTLGADEPTELALTRPAGTLSRPTGEGGGEGRFLQHTPTPIGQPIGAPAIITHVAFAARSPLLLVVAGNSLELWDLTSGTLRSQHRLNLGIRFADLSPDGERIAVACADKSVRLFGAIEGNRLSDRVEHALEVNTVRFSPSGGILMSASDDFTALAWPTGSRVRALYAPIRHQRAVRDAISSPDSGHVLTVSADHTARLWALWQLPTRPIEVPGLTAAESFVFTPNGEKLVVIHRNADVRVHDSTDGTLLRSFPPAEPGYRPGVWNLSPSGRTMVLQESTGSIRLMRLDHPSAEPRLLRHASEVIAMALSPDDTRLAVTSPRGLALWDLDATNAHPARTVPLASVPTLEFSPDSRRLVVAAGDGKTHALHVLAVHDGSLVGTAALPAERVERARFSRDGGLVATGIQGGQVRVWNGTNAAPVSPWIQTGDAVSSLDFRPDGRWLSVGGTAGVVHLFDATTGAPIGSPLAVEPGQVSVEFSPDGEWLLTAGIEAADGHLTLWHAGSGVAVSESLRYRGLRGAQFGHDGRRVLLGNTRRFSAGKVINEAHMHLYGPAALPPNNLLLAMAELVTGTRIQPGHRRRELTPVEFRARQEMLKLRYGIPAPTPHLITFR